jgi:hypothetical protein
MNSFRDKVNFCKSLSIITVCSDIGGVEFRGSGKSVASPLRAGSKNNSFSVDERNAAVLAKKLKLVLLNSTQGGQYFATLKTVFGSDACIKYSCTEYFGQSRFH